MTEAKSAARDPLSDLDVVSETIDGVQGLADELLIKYRGYADYLALKPELEAGLELNKEYSSLYVNSALGPLKLSRDGKYFGELNGQGTHLFHGLEAGELIIEARNSSGQEKKSVVLQAGSNASVSFSLFSLTKFKSCCSVSEIGSFVSLFQHTLQLH